MDLLILDLAQKYPVLLSIVAVVGVLRLVLKPLMSIARSVAASTASEKDDLVLDKVEASPIWKGLIWVVDYVSSIKLPGAK